MKFFKFILSSIVCFSLVLLNSCSKDEQVVVREYSPVGTWKYDGFAYSATTDFTPANDTLKKDLVKRNNKTSEYILELTKDGKYTISEYTVLRDRGRYEQLFGSMMFVSEMNEKSELDSASLYLNTNDLTLSYDLTYIYDKHCLDSLGLSNAGHITVYEANYHYLFKRIK